MRTLKLLALGLILLAVVVLAVANREAVVLHLLPPGLDRVMALSIELPLFVVILVSVVAGMVLGYLLEWLREQVAHLRRETGRPEDDVLALLGR